MPNIDQTEYILTPQRTGRVPNPPDAAWDVLDRFVRQLQNASQTNDQVRLILEAICEATGADAVFWYSSASDEEPQIIGKCSLAPDWCRQFAERMLEESPAAGSRLLLSAVASGPSLLPESLGAAGNQGECLSSARGQSPSLPAAPASAALVRLSKSKSAWIVALRFHAERPFQPTDIKVMTLAKRILLGYRQQARVYDKWKETLFGLVGCLTTAIDAKDPYKRGHSERVARIAVRLGQQLRLPGELLSDLYLAGLLHDIGKIGVSERVLQKPGALTSEEQAEVRSHITAGDRVLGTIKQLQHLRLAVRHHHEHYDGKGYPEGLAREQIPLLARILAVADACDAMMSARPHRAALAPERMEAVLAEGAGKQWDPQIVEQFLACRQELYSICCQGGAA